MKHTFKKSIVVCALCSFSRFWKQLQTEPCSNCVLGCRSSWHRPSKAVV